MLKRTGARARGEMTPFYSTKDAGLLYAPPASGLILRLARGSESGSDWIDSSGKSHDMTLSGATWQSGTRGREVNFNGSSNYGVSTAHADFDAGTSVTVCAWVRLATGTLSHVSTIAGVRSNTGT